MPKRMRALRNVGAFLGTKNDLRKAFAIAQIDENDATEVPPGMNPAGELDLLANVGGAEGVAVVRAIHDGERRVSVWAKGVNAQVIPSGARRNQGIPERSNEACYREEANGIRRWDLSIPLRSAQDDKRCWTRLSNSSCGTSTASRVDRVFIFTLGHS